MHFPGLPVVEHEAVDVIDALQDKEFVDIEEGEPLGLVLERLQKVQIDLDLGADFGPVAERDERVRAVQIGCDRCGERTGIVVIRILLDVVEADGAVVLDPLLDRGFLPARAGDERVSVTRHRRMRSGCALPGQPDRWRIAHGQGEAPPDCRLPRWGLACRPFIKEAGP